MKGLFETEKFYTAYKDLETARKCLRDGDYDGAITSSVSCLESVIKTILDRMDIQYPSDEAVTSLWKAVRVPLQLDTIISTEHTIALLGNLTGTVQYLGGMRNKISDAHGKGEVAPEVPYMLAELAINSASVITTLLIRRYIQLRSS